VVNDGAFCDVFAKLDFLEWNPLFVFFGNEVVRVMGRAPGDEQAERFVFVFPDVLYGQVGLDKGVVSLEPYLFGRIGAVEMIHILVGAVVYGPVVESLSAVFGDKWVSVPLEVPLADISCFVPLCLTEFCDCGEVVTHSGIVGYRAVCHGVHSGH